MLNVFASECSISDSILIDKLVFAPNDCIISKNLAKEDSNLLAQFIHLELSNLEDNSKLIEENDSIRKEMVGADMKKKEVKSKRKNRARMLSVFTFLSGFICLTLLVVGIVMRMTAGIGGLTVLIVRLGFIPLTFLLAYFAYKKINLLTQQTGNYYGFYRFLIFRGIYLAAIPIGFVLFAAALILYARLQGEI